MPHGDKTLADYLKAEEELGRRRFVHHTRPKGPLSMAAAAALCARMDGRSLAEQAAESRAREVEAAIQRFRECGVEIERFSIVERQRETFLCIDGVARFSWRISWLLDSPGKGT